MKTTRILIVTAALGLGAPSLAILSGCAGTATTRSTGEYLDDTTVNAKVKAELLRDPVVSGLAVNVDTYQGTVQLSGFVDSAQQAQRAEQIARNTPGVQNVQNHLAVKPRTNP
jgi:osmotically-inducible protein OsmY